LGRARRSITNLGICGTVDQFAWLRRAVKPQGRAAARRRRGPGGDGADQAIIGRAASAVSRFGRRRGNVAAHGARDQNDGNNEEGCRTRRITKAHCNTDDVDNGRNSVAINLSNL
jgi:hypothetical protein